MKAGLATVLVALVLSVQGCSTENARSGGASAPSSASASTPTESITMIDVPPPPPSGRVDAEITQSSHDRAHGRVQVLLSNGTARVVRPTRIVYRDDRLSASVPAGRLRELPPGGHRQYPVVLPAPNCTTRQDGGDASVLLVAGAVHRLGVVDENDDIGKYVAARCFQQRVERSVRLRLGLAIADDEGSAALVLHVRVVDAASSEPVRLLTVLGTPLFAPADASGAWSPDTRLATGRIRLPVVPARCDPHAFGEGGEMTVFALTLTAGGARGSFKLALDAHDKRALYTYALTRCGLD